MKTYYQKAQGIQSFSNFPIKINESKAKLSELEITEEEFAQINDGRVETILSNGKLKFTAKPLTEKELKKQAINVEKQDLKAKIEGGTATDEDVKNALKLLL